MTFLVQIMFLPLHSTSIYKQSSFIRLRSNLNEKAGRPVAWWQKHMGGGSSPPMKTAQSAIYLKKLNENATTNVSRHQTYPDWGRTTVIFKLLTNYINALFFSCVCGGQILELKG
jgi:hypothetical protein